MIGLFIYRIGFWIARLGLWINGHDYHEFVKWWIEKERLKPTPDDERGEDAEAIKCQEGMRK